MSGRVHVRAGIVAAMLGHARDEGALECCGLLAGRADVITNIFPAENALHSATAYEIAPRELFHIFRRMRAQRLKHLGIYHSHPRTENLPSPTDIEQAGYPDAVYFIISPARPEGPRVRAFSIREGQAAELEIVPVD